MNRFPVNLRLLIWARERAGPDPLALTGSFPKLISGVLLISGAKKFIEARA